MATLRVESATKLCVFPVPHRTASCSPPEHRVCSPFASTSENESVARQTKGRRFTHARPPTMAHGSGWMHGLVKAVPSGDCVVVMGNAAQVSARVYPPARTAASRQKRVQTNNRSSARVPPPARSPRAAAIPAIHVLIRYPDTPPDREQGGPPPEKTITLASLVAPRMVRAPRPDRFAISPTRRQQRRAPRPTFGRPRDRCPPRRRRRREP